MCSCGSEPTVDFDGGEEEEEEEGVQQVRRVDGSAPGSVSFTQALSLGHQPRIRDPVPTFQQLFADLLPHSAVVFVEPVHLQRVASVTSHRQRMEEFRSGSPVRRS